MVTRLLLEVRSHFNKSFYCVNSGPRSEMQVMMDLEGSMFLLSQSEKLGRVSTALS